MKFWCKFLEEGDIAEAYGSWVTEYMNCRIVLFFLYYQGLNSRFEVNPKHMNEEGCHPSEWQAFPPLLAWCTRYYPPLLAWCARYYPPLLAWCARYYPPLLACCARR